MKIVDSRAWLNPRYELLIGETSYQLFTSVYLRNITKLNRRKTVSTVYTSRVSGCTDINLRLPTIATNIPLLRKLI